MSQNKILNCNSALFVQMIGFSHFVHKDVSWLVGFLQATLHLGS